MRFSEWLNKTMMTSFRSFVLSMIAAICILVFTIISCILLLDNASASAALNKDPAIRAAAQTTESAHHSAGKEIATLIFSFLTAAIVTNAFSQYGDRTTAKEHVEAKERGKVAGAAAAAVAAKLAKDASGGASDLRMTAEHVAITETKDAD